jgi:hypothetical protein
MPFRFYSTFSPSVSRRRARFLAALGALLLTGVLSRPAAAQLDVQTAVVLDFEVYPGLDPNLGRKAADALAVELQTSTASEAVARQRVEVVPRQRVEQVMNDTTALTPPYTDIIQLRLSRATGASSVYSGRILSARVADRQAARVTLEIIQFDASMGAYSNGAVVSQSAIDKNGNTDNDLLLDEAINKAIYSGLLEIKRKPYPIGTIQIVTRDYALMNLGTRNGVARGQIYAILRDVYRGRDATDRDIVERVKIAECVVTHIDVDQASVLPTAGGAAGIKISDKVRRIYVPFTFAPEPRDLDARVANSKNLTLDQIEAQDTAAAIRRQEEAARQREALARQAEAIMAQRRGKKRKRSSSSTPGY